MRNYYKTSKFISWLTPCNLKLYNLKLRQHIGFQKYEERQTLRIPHISVGLLRFAESLVFVVKERLFFSHKGIKNGKAAGVDDLTVEQLKHLGPVAMSWLLAFFNACLETKNIPKLWRRTKIIALPKPGSLLMSPKTTKKYRCYALLINCLKAVEPKLIPEQAGCKPGKSTSDLLII